MTVQNTSSSSHYGFGVLTSLISEMKSGKKHIKDGVFSEVKSMTPKKAVDRTKDVISIVEKVTDIASKIFKFISLQSIANYLVVANDSLKNMKVVDALLVPFNLINLFKHVKSFIHGDRSERIDLGLSAIGDIESVKGNVSTVTDGLQTIGVKGAGIVKLTAGLNVMSSIFSLTAQIGNFRSLYKLGSFKKKFYKMTPTKQIGESSMEEYREALALLEKEQLKDKGFVRRLFNFDEDKFADRLIEIQEEADAKISSGDAQKQLEGRQQLHKTLQSLRGRVKYEYTSSAVKTALAVAGLILGLIAFRSSAVIASVAGSVISVGQLAYHKFSEYSFSKNLGLKRKWHEWITC